MYCAQVALASATALSLGRNDSNTAQKLVAFVRRHLQAIGVRQIVLLLQDNTTTQHSNFSLRPVKSDSRVWECSHFGWQTSSGGKNECKLWCIASLQECTLHLMSDREMKIAKTKNNQNILRYVLHFIRVINYRLYSFTLPLRARVRRKFVYTVVPVTVIQM